MHNEDSLKLRKNIIFRLVRRSQISKISRALWALSPGFTLTSPNSSNAGRPPQYCQTNFQSEGFHTSPNCFRNGSLACGLTIDCPPVYLQWSLRKVGPQTRVNNESLLSTSPAVFSSTFLDITGGRGCPVPAGGGNLTWSPPSPAPVHESSSGHSPSSVQPVRLVIPPQRV